MQEPFEGVNPELTEVDSLRDPDTGKWRRNFAGIILGQVPLDPRSSLYSRLGDWFPVLCVLGAILCCFRPTRKTL